MPYRWIQTVSSEGQPAAQTEGAAQVELVLTPFRSLPLSGFVLVIAATAILLLVPLLAILGTTAMWGLLPFAALVIWALWVAIQRSYRSGTVREHLLIDRDSLTLTRHDPGRPDRIWQTTPYWLRIALRRDGPVEHYLTLSDGRREIELGAFLTPEERQSLRQELERELALLRSKP